MQKLLLIIVALAGLAFLFPDPGKAEVSPNHYLYACAGYSYSADTGLYTLPADCKANPYLAPGTHSWITDQVPAILTSDGKTGTKNQLHNRVLAGHGYGSDRLKALRDGVVAADTKLNGCTAHGRSIGWPIGDHMSNPYRHFGVWSYYQQPRTGWQGYGHAASRGRTTGSCARAPRIRTKSAFMAQEFFNRAIRSWKQQRSGDAMYNLGISLHAMQDAAVPSHAHPELKISSIQVRNPRGTVVQGQDVFPAWSNAHKDEHRVTSDGLYQLPASINGVRLAQDAHGFTYGMAATAYPYTTYHQPTSAIPQSAYRCDVTNFPEDCREESAYLLEQVQRYSAGLVNLFFERVR